MLSRGLFRDRASPNPTSGLPFPFRITSMSFSAWHGMFFRSSFNCNRQFRGILCCGALCQDPFVLNRCFRGFTPSTQTYSYPLDSVKIYSGSKNVTVAPGARGSIFKSVGPVNPHQYFPNQLFAQSWVYEGLAGYMASMARSNPSLPLHGLSRTFLLEEVVIPSLFGRALLR